MQGFCLPALGTIVLNKKAQENRLSWFRLFGQGFKVSLKAELFQQMSFSRDQVNHARDQSRESLARPT